jgi:hypothetical protein
MTTDRINIQEFEKNFQMITGIVLGKKLVNHADYEKWLTRYVMTIEQEKSKISEKIVQLPPFQFYRDIRNNVVDIDEAYEILGKKQLSESELNAFSFSNAKTALKNISTTTPDTRYGVNSNILDCPLYYNSHSCYKSPALNKSRGCLYSFWPRYSEYLVGCYYTFSSKYCVKCYNSQDLTRCFEVSDSNNCSDCYFCHNVENLQNCMFCFNVKSKRYAIANVEVGPEAYSRIKKLLLDDILKKLEKDKDLKISVYELAESNQII